MMRTRLLLFCILFISIFSCNNCDCETDCPKEENKVIVLTSENTITLKELQLMKDTLRIKKNDLKLNELKSKANDIIDDLNGLNVNIDDIIKRKPCVPCPDRPKELCCNSKIFIDLDSQFQRKTKSQILEELKIKTKDLTKINIIEVDSRKFIEINLNSFEDQFEMTLNSSENGSDKILINSNKD